MSGDRLSLLIPPELDAEMTPGVRAFVVLLLRRIETLEAEVADLRAELAAVKKTPRNSSLPPGSEHPHAKPAPKPKKKSRKKRGGQPGHARHERALIPAAECVDVIRCVPTDCRRCGATLSGRDAQPLRHQVWDVPEIQPLVTEYQRHRLTCTCGATTCGVLPDGVPPGQAGPRLIALVALLMGSFRQSKRRVAVFLEQVLNQPCSPGWVVKLQQQATTALQPAYDELVARLPEQDVLGIDESPTKEGASKAWLWTGVAKDFTVFALRTTRAATVLDEWLTNRFQGTVTCDRAKMSWRLPRIQWCWAHLKRDFQAWVDSADHQAKRLGRDPLRPVQSLFHLWSRCRDGTLTRRGWKRLMRPVCNAIDSLLLRGVCRGNRTLVGPCRELFAHRHRLWTFVDVDQVEPTNNASERALRHAVIWRKLSFGTQSAAGSRFVETLLTVVETCRQQSRPVFAFLTETLQAHFARQSTPSLAGA
jgi:transposase